MKILRDIRLWWLLRRAKAMVDRMTPEQRAEMYRQQRESWGQVVQPGAKTRATCKSGKGAKCKNTL